jgi:tetratricopeptide (TPR) repeat protein
MFRLIFFGLLLSANLSLALAQDAPAKQLARATALLKAGELDAAEKELLRLLPQPAQAPFVHHHLGIVYQQRKDHPRAIAQFRRALRGQPNFGPTRLLLGVSLLASGNAAAAVPELEAAVKLLPQEPQARLHLAKGYEAQDNWLGVVEQWRALRALQPQEAEYAYQLGRAYTKLSGWSYQRIARLNPNSARLHQSSGQNYLLQEKYDLALEAYQKEAAPTLPEIHLALALIYLEQKNIAAAQREIELELKLVPESQKARAAQQKIAAAKEQ